MHKMEQEKYNMHVQVNSDQYAINFNCQTSLLLNVIETIWNYSAREQIQSDNLDLC